MTVTDGAILRVVATIAWTDGDVAQNVFNCIVSGGAGPYDEDDVIDDMLDWVEDMYGEIVAGFTNEFDGSQVQVYEYDTVEDDWDELGSRAWVWNPTIATSYLPRGVAVLVNAKTADADVNGKKYLAGITEDLVEDGVISPTLITLVEAFALAWVTNFVGASAAATYLPAVWSVAKTTASAMSGTTLVPTIPAYQRRRKKGVGI